MSLSWVTPAGFLFTATLGQSVSGSLSANETGTSYTIISGSLPEGISLSSTGTFSGTPTPIINPTTSTFVVRAEKGNEKKDRTFQIFVPNENPPVWDSPYGFVQIGAVLQGFVLNQEWVDIKFTAGPPLIHSDDYAITYKVDKTLRRLPKSLTLSTDGHLRGVMKQDLLPGEYFPFEFRIIASDGYATSSQTVIVNVIDSDTFRTDSTTLRMSTGTATISLLDLSLPGSVSFSHVIPPEFINGSDLGLIHSNDKHYIPVTAYDSEPEKGPVIYSLTTGSTLPAGLSLDPMAGYLYGYISTQTEYLTTYSFGIQARKIDRATLGTSTASNTFTLGILGDTIDAISWISDSDLGSVEQNLISELSVKASAQSGSELYYRLMPGEQLPEGVSLLSSGNIVGEPKVPGIYTATVLASTTQYSDENLQGSVFTHVFSTQSVTVNVTPVSKEYTSIYVKPFLSIPQRQQWTAFINDSSIFLPDVLYRNDDPVFGIQQELKMYIEFGIEKLTLGDYVPAMYNNFYKRRLTLGDVKVAIARDKNGTHLYDAVYLDVKDAIEGAKPAVVINNKTYYPGSINNMRDSLESIVLDDYSTISVDEHHLPRFMQTAQTAGASPTSYIKSIVLCYTQPGSGTKISSRIKASGFDFGLIDFEIDRLVVQNSVDNNSAKYLIFNRTDITE